MIGIDHVTVWPETATVPVVGAADAYVMPLGNTSVTVTLVTSVAKELLYPMAKVITSPTRPAPVLAVLVKVGEHSGGMDAPELLVTQALLQLEPQHTLLTLEPQPKVIGAALVLLTHALAVAPCMSMLPEVVVNAPATLEWYCMTTLPVLPVIFPPTVLSLASVMAPVVDRLPVTLERNGRLMEPELLCTEPPTVPSPPRVMLPAPLVTLPATDVLYASVIEPVVAVMEPPTVACPLLSVTVPDVRFALKLG